MSRQAKPNAAGGSPSVDPDGSVESGKDDALEYLNTPARTIFRSSLQSYSEALLREASRLEAAGKSTPGSPEITSTMVKDADILLRRGYSRPRKQPLLIMSQLVATVGGFLTGLLADANRLKEPKGLVLFVLVLTVTITAAVIAILKD
jgi:hypothetical protein